MASNLFWFFIFCILPIIWVPYFQEPFELPKVLAFISITLIYLGYCVASIPLHIGYVKKYRLDILLLIFLVLNLVSNYINGALSLGWWGQFYRYEGTATLLGLFSIYWLSSRINVKHNRINFYILWGGVINILWLLGQNFMGISGRLSGNLGNPNFTGGFIALTAVGITNVYLWPVFVIGILFTGSWTAAIGLAVVFAMRYFRNSIWVFVLLFITIILGISIFMPIRPVSHFDSRVAIWNKAIMAINEKPILGWGRENFETAFKANLGSKDFDLKNIRVDKAHNETLEVMTATGIVGVIIYYWIIFEAGLALWKQRWNKYAYTNLVALVAFVVMSQFNVLNITEYIFLYFTLGTARALKIRE